MLLTTPPAGGEGDTSLVEHPDESSALADTLVADRDTLSKEPSQALP